MMAGRGYRFGQQPCTIIILRSTGAENESLFSNKNLKIHIGGNLLSKFTWNITRRTSIKVNHMLYKGGL